MLIAQNILKFFLLILSINNLLHLLLLNLILSINQINFISHKLLFGKPNLLSLFVNNLLCQTISNLLHIIFLFPQHISHLFISIHWSKTESTSHSRSPVFSAHLSFGLLFLDLMFKDRLYNHFALPRLQLP